MQIRFAAAAAVFLLPLTAMAQTPPSPTIQGQLKIGTKTVNFTHVYAKRVNDVEGDRLSGPEKSITLLFTDKTINADEMDDWFHLSDLARTGKFHAVELRFDPATSELFGATVFYSAKPQDPPANITLSGKDANHRIDHLVLQPDTIAGTAVMAQPEYWPQMRTDLPDLTFTYHMEFRAPIWNSDPITANLTGDDAKASPEAVAARAFFTALRAGDIFAVRRLSLPNPQMETALRKVGADNVSAFLAQAGPEPTAFASSITRVVERGDRSSIIAGGGLRVKMVRRNGNWVISP